MPAAKKSTKSPAQVVAHDIIAAVKKDIGARSWERLSAEGQIVELRAALCSAMLRDFQAHCAISFWGEVHSEFMSVLYPE